MSRNFADRLFDAVCERTSPLCVGIDPLLERLPEPLRRQASLSHAGPRAAGAAAIESFARGVIDVVADRAACVKLQMAFFEVWGHHGIRAAEAVVRDAREHGLLVIGDLKRGDIGSTSDAFARAYLGPDAPLPFDAITVSPYMGSDAVKPYLAPCAAGGTGLFVLVRTSNPSSGEIQGLVCDGEPTFRHVARLVESWGADLLGDCGLSAVGAVMGATFPRELAEARRLLPRTPFLVPGVGAQGGGAADAAPAFLPGGLGAVVNSSRGILYAHEKAPPGTPWEEAVRQAAGELRRSLLRAAGGADA